MNRFDPDIFQMILGAGALLVLLVLGTFVRALILRWRRKRKNARSWRETIPVAEHPAIQEIRQEVHESEQRLRAAEWHHDGEIVLAERKKPPEETP